MEPKSAVISKGRHLLLAPKAQNRGGRKRSHLEAVQEPWQYSQQAYSHELKGHDWQSKRAQKRSHILQGPKYPS